MKTLVLCAEEKDSWEVSQLDSQFLNLSKNSPLLCLVDPARIYWFTENNTDNCTLSRNKFISGRAIFLNFSNNSWIQSPLIFEIDIKPQNSNLDRKLSVTYVRIFYRDLYFSATYWKIIFLIYLFFLKQLFGWKSNKLS